MRRREGKTAKINWFPTDMEKEKVMEIFVHFILYKMLYLVNIASSFCVPFLSPTTIDSVAEPLQ